MVHKPYVVDGPMRSGMEIFNVRSRLPQDFFAFCTNRLGASIHTPLIFGRRSTNMRSLNTLAPIEKNKLIFAVPMRSVFTNETATRSEFAMPDVTVDVIRNAIRDDEFKLLAEHMHLGFQMASIVHNIPDYSKLPPLAATAADGSGGSLTAMQRFEELERRAVSDMIPWARVVDDEEFSDDFALQTFGGVLDTWQRESFNDMVRKFDRAQRQIFSAVKPPFDRDMCRRITRVVIARTEHLPPPDVYSGSRLQRQLRAAMRAAASVLARKSAAERQREELRRRVVGVVPLIDMLNHSNRPNVVVRTGPCPELGGEPAVMARASQDIRAEEELCRLYNFAVSPDAGLFRYGFLPIDMINVVDHDAARGHLEPFYASDILEPEAPEAVAERDATSVELRRMENLFKSARSRKEVDPRLDAKTLTPASPLPQHEY